MSRFKDEADDYAGTHRAESDAAWRVSGLATGDVWLPKSQCDMDPPNARIGDRATFTIPNWLAEEKELV